MTWKEKLSKYTIYEIPFCVDIIGTNKYVYVLVLKDNINIVYFFDKANTDILRNDWRAYMSHVINSELFIKRLGLCDYWYLESVVQ